MLVTVQQWVHEGMKHQLEATKIVFSKPFFHFFPTNKKAANPLYQRVCGFFAASHM
jgi:hypothetical protein